MTDKSLNCSFCGKSREDVEKLIAGPGVYICNECITISYEILDADDDIDNIDDELQGVPSPKEIYEYLNEYVSGQDYTKKILSTCAYNHYKRIHHKSRNKSIEIEKSNVLLLGPTGSGKTLFAKTLAKKLNVPFAVADATTLTEAGYVGDDVESVLDRLLSVADYDVEAAQKGIVYIDEIDKKARKSESSTTKDVSGEGVQQALLRLIEGTTTKVKIGSGKKFGEDYVDFDTTQVLFILGGAFVGMEEHIVKRLQKTSSIGFTGNVMSKADKGSKLHEVTPEDVVKFGLIPELVGRLPVITTLEELSEDQLVHIMTSVKNNVIDQVKELLTYENIELEFSLSYYREVAKKAIEMKMGARAVKSIVESSLFYVMYNAPDLHNSGVVKIKFDNYPSKQIKPVAVYKDSTETELTDYTFFRGMNEKQ